MSNFDKVQDSGKRQQFNTGSQRDTDEGKGQPHLMPFEVIKQIDNMLYHILSDFNYKIRSFDDLLRELIDDIYDYGVIREQESQLYLLEAIEDVIKLIAILERGHYTKAYKRLAIHYQNGAKKYDKNNWRKGQPVSRYYDSVIRHLWSVQAGLQDEDHLAAIFWNLVAILQTKKDIKKGLLLKELDDFPFTIKDVFGEQK